MSRASALGAVRYDAEASWSEISSTYQYRLASLDAVDASGLMHAKIPAARTVQRLQDGTMPIRGVMGGSFKIRLWLAGHGSTTAGATTTTDLARLLGYVIGNNTASAAAGTTITGAASTTTSLNVTAATGFTAGSMGFLGVLNDGGGGGQAFVLSAHTASVITLLTAVGAAPAAGAVVYSSELVYPYENASAASVTGLRFHLMTANQQYGCHGCYPTSVSFNGLGPGETPAVEITFGVSWWEPLAETFPTTTSVDAFNPAPVAAGSFYLQQRGTTTRATYSIRSFTLNYEIGVEPKRGPGGINAFQDIIGAERTPSRISLQVSVDAQTASTSPTWPAAWDSDTQFYHGLYTLSAATSGKQIAFYWPNLCISQNKTVQFAESNLNKERIDFDAYTSTTVTTDLTASAMRIALG